MKTKVRLKYFSGRRKANPMKNAEGWLVTLFALITQLYMSIFLPDSLLDIYLKYTYMFLYKELTFLFIL